MWRLRTYLFTETAHFLPDHPGACANLHGHSYKWTVTIGARTLNSDDMVMDFSDFKKIASDVIMRYDHAIVIKHDPEYIGDMALVIGHMKKLIMAKNPTAEVMAKDVYDNIKRLLPSDIKLVEVICRETENNEAIYSEE